jgi:DNA mismatch endonuclease (patch repair protein)
MTTPDEARSTTMRAVRSVDTKPELLVRSLLHGLGYRFRLHQKDLAGKPDLVFSRRKKIIFVHGCFWHGHDCKRGSRQPKTNIEYWKKKISRNKARDLVSISSLEESGWNVMVVWECELGLAKRDALINNLKQFLGHPRQ